jgi:site-specific recombinase XerD
MASSPLSLALAPPAAENDPEAQLVDLVLNGVTSGHTRRSYRTGLKLFFAWIGRSGEPAAFSKAFVQQYRAELIRQGLAASTINLRLAPVRKLARELSDNGALEPAVAAAIERVPGVQQLGSRAGNWLTRDQANDLLNAPSLNTLAGKRDRAILALLIGCGLRRAELLRLNIEDLQQRESRWVIPDLVGKGNRLRLVTVPAGVKARIDAWVKAADMTEGRLFRPVTKAGKLDGDGIRDEKAIWRLVMRYAKETELGRLAPHDLRRTCAKLCRKAGGDLEQIRLLLGHASIQTTERYLGTEQALAHAVNDGIGLELG